jgi:hypothetical protein
MTKLPLLNPSKKYTLKEYIEIMTQTFDQSDVNEVTLDIGIVMEKGQPIVYEASPNRVKFTVKRDKK